MNEALEKRKFKYMDAASYFMKVMGDKQKAMTMLNYAEKLKGIMTDLKLTGTVDQSNLVSMLSPEIMFG